MFYKNRDSIQQCCTNTGHASEPKHFVHHGFRKISVDLALPKISLRGLLCHCEHFRCLLEMKGGLTDKRIF